MPHRLLVEALHRRNTSNRPPIWFMRQAGRYHTHYRALRNRYSFLELCKRPEVAAEVALGPVADFDFDAAILFSDILFPLEAMLTAGPRGHAGPVLDFAPGPVFTQYLHSPADLAYYRPADEIAPDYFDFQRQALELTRQALPPEKALLGFVGGPLTLYLFAVAGSLKGDSAHRDLTLAGLHDGRFCGLLERLIPLLVRNLRTQAQARPDCIAILDSHAGDWPLLYFETAYLPFLRRMIHDFRTHEPDLPLLYYGKGFTPAHWALLTDLPIEAIGVDASQDLPMLLATYGAYWAIQGNFDQRFLAQPESVFEQALAHFIATMQQVPAAARRGWICGLGHGITPDASETYVRRFIFEIRKAFA